MNPMHHAPAHGPLRQDQLDIGGEWLDSVDGRLVDVMSATSRSTSTPWTCGSPSETDARAHGLR